MPLEPYRIRSMCQVLRQGLFPQFTDGQLAALRTALLHDDPALIQHYTTRPIYSRHAHNGLVKPLGACFIGYAGWKGGCETIAEIQAYFDSVCHQSDKLLDHVGDLEYFLNTFDKPEARAELWPILLHEVQAEQARRAEAKEERPETIYVRIAGGFDA
jgi:hypothetical protein